VSTYAADAPPAETTAEASPPPPTAEGGGIGTGTAANGDIPSAGEPNDVTTEVGHRAEGAKPGSDHPSELEPDVGSDGDDMADPDVEDVANEDFGDADDDFDDFDDDAELEDLEASLAIHQEQFVCTVDFYRICTRNCSPDILYCILVRFNYLYCKCRFF
jgi:hypothetical protein